MTAGRRIDNLLLLPAACVADYADWQARANHLPLGTVLIVLPAEPGRQREALERAARALLAKGRRVIIEDIPALVALVPSQQPDWSPVVGTAVQLALECGDLPPNVGPLIMRHPPHRSCRTIE